jgi:hypothetical protein
MAQDSGERVMKPVKRLLFALITLAVILIAVRYYRHYRDRARAFLVVADLGGSVGSIPFEPLGTEYRISFRDRRLTREDLDRLTALEPLASRNPVEIHFKNSGLTEDDLLYLQKLLPSVRLVSSSEARDEHKPQPADYPTRGSLRL